jgi:hypothetical protein
MSSVSLQQVTFTSVSVNIHTHIETLPRRREKVDYRGIPSLPANHKISAQQ